MKTTINRAKQFVKDHDRVVLTAAGIVTGASITMYLKRETCMLLEVHEDDILAMTNDNCHVRYEHPNASFVLRMIPKQ